MRRIAASYSGRSTQVGHRGRRRTRPLWPAGALWPTGPGSGAPPAALRVGRQPNPDPARPSPKAMPPVTLDQTRHGTVLPVLLQAQP